MTKNEFLDKLRIALNGKVSASLVEENMTYYNEYIDSQLRTGKSEEEVMNLLGDPRLIARTIVQTNGIDTAEDAAYRENSSYDEATYDGDSYGSGAYNSNHYGNSGYNNTEDYSGMSNEVRVRTLPGWLVTIIVIAVIVCVIGFIFSVVSFLLPFVLPILVVMFFVKLFRDWLN